MPNIYPNYQLPIMTNEFDKKFPGPMASLPERDSPIDYFFINEQEMHEYISHLKEIILVQQITKKTEEEMRNDLKRKIIKLEERISELEKTRPIKTVFD